MRSANDLAPGLNVRLDGKRLALARAGWILIAVLCLLLFVLGTAAQDRWIRVPCSEVSTDLQDTCWPTEDALNQIGITWDDLAVLSTVTSVIGIVPFFLMGWLVFWRSSENLFLLLFSLGAVVSGSVIINENLVQFVVSEHPGLSLPTTLVHFFGVIFVGLVPFFFPDGRFVPHWTRWLAVVWIGRALYMDFVPFIPALWNSSVNDSLQLLLFPTLVANVYAVVYRYRHDASPVQRQQIKWVSFALIVLLPVVAGRYALFRLWRPGFFSLFIYGVYEPFYYLVALFVAACLAISILRFRLWDIDIFINRTLVYATLSAALGLIYFSSVVLLQRIFPVESEIAVVASTLTIAALFAPLRRGIQISIDSRFYRRKYDAQRTVSALGKMMRNEVELDRLSDVLVQTVRETLQPKGVSLWLHQPKDEA